MANDVSAPGAGFEHETNQVVIIDASGMDHDVPLSDKRAIADAVWDAIVAWRASAGTRTTPNASGPHPGAGTQEENL